MRHCFVILLALLNDICLCATLHEISDAAGVLESPGYPGDYGNNADITWKFKVKPGYKIRLVIEEFDIEDSNEDSGENCVRDYLKVRALCICD